MILISTFKDFYDYLIGEYGIDPYIVYNRTKIQCPKDWHKSKITNHNNDTDKSILHIPNNISFNVHGVYADYQWLVILGKAYLLIVDEKSRKYARLDNNNSHQVTKYWGNYNKKKFRLDDYSGVELPGLREFSRKIKQPVYRILSSKWNTNTKSYIISVLEDIPKLSEFDITKLYTPEQFYMDLNYYIGNILTDNGDMNPPLAISDKDQIVSKGFDTKISFRHRT